MKSNMSKSISKTTNSSNISKDNEQYRPSFTISMAVKDVLQKLAEADDRSLANYIRKILTEHAEKAIMTLVTNNDEPEVSNDNINNKLNIKEQDTIINSMANPDTVHNKSQTVGQNNVNNDGILSFKLPTVKIKNNPF